MSGSGKASYYDVLGVAQDASAEDIRKAYFMLSLMYHPDKQSREEVRFYGFTRYQEIQEGYQVLSDPVKRTVYDAGLNARKQCCGDTGSNYDGGATMVAQEAVNMDNLLQLQRVRRMMSKRGGSSSSSSSGPSAPPNPTFPRGGQGKPQPRAGSSGPRRRRMMLHPIIACRLRFDRED